MGNPDRSLAAEIHRKAGGVFGAIGLGLILALGLAVFFLPLKSWMSEGQAIKAQLDGFGLAAPLVFVAGSALLAAIGAPRLVLCSLAGLLFGVSRGLLWSQLGTLLGAYGTFLAVRTFGREAILRRYPKLDRYSERIRGRGLLAVLLIRQLPMNGFHNNLLLGLSPVGHRDFLLGSLLGYLPLGVTAVLIGAGAVQTDPSRLIQYATAALAAFLLLGFLLKQWVGLARRAGPPPLSANNGLD
jgi:uncharacterized membrane protein YdjX (TVP38/TMEM64 family)